MGFRRTLLLGGLAAAGYHFFKKEQAKSKESEAKTFE